MKKICIIGGGAAGLACAVILARARFSVTLIERGERVGRKLSSTGNGQGNVTNVHVNGSRYFSDDRKKVEGTLGIFGYEQTVTFLESMGGFFRPDARGRVYPVSRQASAVTDMFRRELDCLGVHIITGACVQSVRCKEGKFDIAWADGHMSADKVILCTGGKAAPNFGTDGSGYALAQAFGHTLTPLSPVLVQLRCEKEGVRGLKGIRVDANLKVVHEGREIYRVRGDVLFTDTGVSGDSVFRASSYAVAGDKLLIDFLPEINARQLHAAAGEGENALLCIVNNALARVLYKKADGNRDKTLELVKNYPLTVTGTLGFDYAQVTRGGIPLAEVSEYFESKKQAGLYFAGEILNVDGECGGYNLQWAFASAFCACAHIIGEGA